MPQPAQQASIGAALYDNETQDFGLAPTNDIRTGDFEAPTPTRISGAKTITTVELRDMIQSSTPPVVIDVLGGNVNASLPDAVWLRGAGLGTSIQDDTQQRLAARLGDLTRGAKATPIVFLCLSKICWLSHNAVIRAVNLGYSNVFWYRGGRNAWLAAGLHLQPVRAMPF